MTHPTDDELMQMCDKATPMATGKTNKYAVVMIEVPVNAKLKKTWSSQSDKDFYFAARDAIPRLIEEKRRMEKALQMIADLNDRNDEWRQIARAALHPVKEER